MMNEGDTSEIKKIFKLYSEVNKRYLGKSFYQMKDLGIYPKQIGILQMIYDNNGCSQKEIADKLSIKPPTVNVSIQRLERSGLVIRRKDEHDQRIMRVYMTEIGKEKVNMAIKYVKSSEEIMFKGFTEVELCLMRRFFEQIIKNMEEMPGEIEVGFDYFKKGEMEE